MNEVLPNPHVALNNAREDAAIGSVLNRPTGELALLWRLYAASLDRIERLQKEKRDALRKNK